jgi:hypothetical protein
VSVEIDGRIVRDRVVATCPICLRSFALAGLLDHIIEGHTREVEERLRRMGR